MKKGIEEFIEAVENNEYAHLELPWGVTIVTNYGSDPWLALENSDSRNVTEAEIDGVLKNTPIVNDYEEIEIIEGGQLRSANIIGAEIGGISKSLHED